MTEQIQMLQGAYRSKITLDSLKSIFIVLEGKLSLGAAEYVVNTHLATIQELNWEIAMVYTVITF